MLQRWLVSHHKLNIFVTNLNCLGGILFVHWISTTVGNISQLSTFYKIPQGITNVYQKLDFSVQDLGDPKTSVSGWLVREYKSSDFVNAHDKFKVLYIYFRLDASRYHSAQLSYAILWSSIPFWCNDSFVYKKMSVILKMITLKIL